MSDEELDEDGLPKGWRSRFIEHVNQKIESAGVCPRCGSNNIVVPPKAVAPPVFRGKGIALVGLQYPQAMVLCQNCGHTQFFNLVTIGIIESRAKAEAREQAIEDPEKGDGE